MFTLLSHSLSSHNCVRSKQARARVCMCVCKKGKKIGFALLRSIALFNFRSLTTTCRCVLFGWFGCMCVCDANGMKTAEIYSVALTFFFFFLQQNSVISFLFAFCSCRNRLEISNTNFLLTTNAH